jgi:hypothetical protein
MVQIKNLKLELIGRYHSLIAILKSVEDDFTLGEIASIRELLQTFYNIYMPTPSELNCYGCAFQQ